MPLVTVREFAKLTTASVEPTLDNATVTESAFDWLCRESARLSGSGAPLVQYENRRILRLDNYVGVIETPCGTRLEILPKSSSDGDGPERARSLLKKIICRCLDVPARGTNATGLELFAAPLTEWLMREFLVALERLIKRGVRFDYRRREEQLRYLTGRLDLARQLRQPPGRQSFFHIEHDILKVDCPENRIIKSTLGRVCEITRDPKNWRLSHELSAYLESLPPSNDIVRDFRGWRRNRVMAHYGPIRPWCSLILNELLPMAIVGEWDGISLLFPMEKLFERYVEICLSQQLPKSVRLLRTPSSEHLCRHNGSGWFNLQPDLMIQGPNQRWVLDTKWKLLDSRKIGPGEKYRLSQPDFYQLFAYGHKYCGGVGDLFLVYPRTRDFDEPLEHFDFGADMRLWVVPFDLDSESLVLPENCPIYDLFAMPVKESVEAA